MLRRLNFATATAASGYLIQKAYCETKAQNVASPLAALHEAILSTPLGRRYTAASPLGGSAWALSFTSLDLRSGTKAAQTQVVSAKSRSVESAFDLWYAKAGPEPTAVM